MTAPPIHVVAGALFDAAGRVLIAQRPPGKHMAGGWEFPGGKLAKDEARIAGLIRELREELDIEVETAQPIIDYMHHYADRSVCLDLWLITSYRGTPRSAEGQAIKWVLPRELESADLLPADRPMIEPLCKLAAKRG